MTEHSHRGRARVLAILGLMSLALAVVMMLPANAHENHGDDPHPAAAEPTSTCGEGAESVLFLLETAQDACSNPTVAAAVALGFSVDLVDDAAWMALSTADFASYRAVAMGDYYCSGGTSQVDAAEATVATWTPAVSGNVLVIGTDENFHSGSGGQALTERGMAFVTADPEKTGAYISLSCYYHYFEPADTPTSVEVLAGFGEFKALRTAAISEDDCFNDAHIVATHPALAGLTDADLSNWGCSVHEVLSEWPLGFEVLAIAENIGTEFYTAPDGSQGAPYILARGVDVISDIDLAPPEAINQVGQTHTLTATVAEDGEPVVGTEVTFTVIDGPHAGTTGTGVTNEAGQATFSYDGIAAGTDTIEATFVDSHERTQRSNRVTKTWVDAEGPPGDPSCSDGADNDLDGLTDDADPDCVPPANPCTAGAGDPGLLSDDTLGQTLHDGGLDALAPLVGDPDHAGPLSAPLNDAGDETPLEVVTDEATCVVSLVGPEGDAL